MLQGIPSSILPTYDISLGNRNIQMLSSCHGDSYYEDKTASRPCYIYNRYQYTCTRQTDICIEMGPRRWICWILTRAFNEMIGHNWLILNHQLITTKHSIKSVKCNAFSVTNADRWFVFVPWCSIQPIVPKVPWACAVALCHFLGPQTPTPLRGIVAMPLMYSYTHNI